MPVYSYPMFPHLIGNHTLRVGGWVWVDSVRFHHFHPAGNPIPPAWEYMYPVGWRDLALFAIFKLDTVLPITNTF